MFLRGWPGIGLLLLRLALGFTALAEGAFFLYDFWPAKGGSAVGLVLGTIGCLLLVGLWTPIASAMLVVCLVAISASRTATPADAIHSPMVVFLEVVIAVAMTLLGPGSVSLDYRLFGPREIVISSAKRPD